MANIKSNSSSTQLMLKYIHFFIVLVVLLNRLVSTAKLLEDNQILEMYFLNLAGMGFVRLYCNQCCEIRYR